MRLSTVVAVISHLTNSYEQQMTATTEKDVPLVTINQKEGVVRHSPASLLFPSQTPAEGEMAAHCFEVYLHPCPHPRSQGQCLLPG